VHASHEYSHRQNTPQMNVIQHTNTRIAAEHKPLCPPSQAEKDSPPTACIAWSLCPFGALQSSTLNTVNVTFCPRQFRNTTSKDPYSKSARPNTAWSLQHHIAANEHYSTKNIHLYNTICLPSRIFHFMPASTTLNVDTHAVLNTLPT
jgi:hypothetical protein